MHIEIRNRFNDKIILSGEYESIKDALEKNITINLYGANLDGANLDGASLYRASLVGASLYRASLVGANLVGVNLDGANLDGASLYRANLYRASLYRASLYRASLVGVNLDGANLDGAIVFICGSKHNLQYNKSIGELRIGCHVYHLEYWLIMYDTIGREENYTDEQISEYHNYMKMLKNYL